MAPHDPLFKRLLQRFFADFLRIVAPDVAERLDLSSPMFLDKELNLPEGNRIVDLLVRVPVRTDRGKAWGDARRSIFSPGPSPSPGLWRLS